MFIQQAIIASSSIVHDKALYYALQVETDAAGLPVYAAGADRQVLHLDIRPALDRIRHRRPDIFMGYDRSGPALPKVPDPELPRWEMTEKQRAPAPAVDEPPLTLGHMP